jgi:hypothetical protein
MARPKLTLASVRLLCEVDRYIRQYDIRGPILEHAASDQFDGSYDRDELDELIRKRFLSVLRYDQDKDCILCGSSFTVELTSRAIALFWPDRKGEA